MRKENQQQVSDFKIPPQDELAPDALRDNPGFEDLLAGLQETVHYFDERKSRVQGAIAQGRYGICEICLRKIPKVRLKALDGVITTCVDCERENEVGQRNGNGSAHTQASPFTFGSVGKTIEQQGQDEHKAFENYEDSSSLRNLDGD